MKNYTDITVLLDRSASMVSIQAAMESAFDEFVLGHQAIEDTRLTLYTFDEPLEYRYNSILNTGVLGGHNFDYYKSRVIFECAYAARPIKDVPKLQLVPRGNTPLIDAIVGVVDETGRRLSAMHPASRPSRVLFVIITDGQENASKQFTREDAFARITHQTNVYNWQFLFLGANQDAIGEASKYGIAPQYAMNYAATDKGTHDMMRSVTQCSVRYASGEDLNLTK